MNLERLEQLKIAPGTISCIYYPGGEYPPLLQAMNLSNTEKNLLLDRSFLESASQPESSNCLTINQPINN